MYNNVLSYIRDGAGNRGRGSYCVWPPLLFYVCAAFVKVIVCVTNFDVRSGPSVSTLAFGHIHFYSMKYTHIQWSFPHKKEDLIERKVWAFSKGCRYRARYERNVLAVGRKIIHIFIIILILSRYLRRQIISDDIIEF